MEVQLQVSGEANSVVLFVKSQALNTGGGFKRKDQKKTYKKCTHCGGVGHLKEGCFKLIGYPD